MNASRKAIEWLICFSIVNLILGCLLFKKLKKSVNLAHCQKQLECHQHILIKFRFVKIIFIKPFRFVKAPEDVSEDRSYRSTYGYFIDLIIKLNVKNKMRL